MNNISKTVMYNQGQTSFGSISKSAKMVINSADVRTILEREHGVIGADIRKLDESRLNFSLLSEVIPNLSQTAGLCVTPPRGAMLPRVTVTMPDINLNETNGHFFASMVKKAKDLELVYRNAIKEFGSHPIRKKFTKSMAKIDAGFRKEAKDYVKAYNSSDTTTLGNLEHSFRNNSKRREKLSQTCQETCAVSQESLSAKVIPAWEKIVQQRLV